MECLRFAFDVWRGAQRELGAQAIARTGLVVPTVNGWRNPSRAFFGPGWDGPSADIDRELVDVLVMRRDRSADLDDLARHLLRRPDSIFDIPLVDVDEQRGFMETLGVRHGLHPRHCPAARFRLRGEHVANPVSAGHLVTGMSRTDQREWLKFAQDSGRTVPSQSTTQYTPSADVAVLPGQFDWPAFDEEVRRAFSHLALRCIGAWPDDAFEITFRRSTDCGGRDVACRRSRGSSRRTLGYRRPFPAGAATSSSLNQARHGGSRRRRRRTSCQRSRQDCDVMQTDNCSTA